MVVNTGQEALAWSAATAGQVGSHATLAPSGPARATLAVSRATLAVNGATLAGIAAPEAENDTGLVVSGADLAGSAAALAAAAIALRATLLQIATVAARQRCHPTLSPLLLLSLFPLPRGTSCSN